MTLVASKRPPSPTSMIDGVGRMLGKQHEGHGGEDFEDGDRLAAVGVGDARHRFGEHPVLDQPCRRPVRPGGSARAS